jgi:penicillin-binding protein 1A
VTGSDEQLQSAILIAEPDTGYIVAMAGGVGEKTISRSLNRATQSRRPPGSSIKPLSVYAPAIEYGLITPETRFADSADVRLSGTDWMPKNDDWDYDGVLNIRTAIVLSKNTIAAQVVDWLTPARSYNFMKNVLGFDLPAADSDYAPMSLGQLTYGATVREMVDGYTMFVNDGVVKHTITYTKLFDNEFNLVYENVPETSVAISNVTAYWMTNLLSDAIQHGTGRGANITNIMACAGKTGTTTDMKDRWFSGFTPYYVAVVWTGYDTPAAMSAPNGNPASALWKKVMTLVHQDLPYLEFETPSDTYLKPVPGVDPEVQYTIRGVTLEGEVLYETSETAMKGRTSRPRPVPSRRMRSSAQQRRRSRSRTIRAGISLSSSTNPRN